MKDSYDVTFYLLPSGDLLQDHISNPYMSLEAAKHAAKIAISRLGIPVFIYKLQLACIASPKEPVIEYEEIEYKS